MVLADEHEGEETEAKRSHREILLQELSQGLEELGRPALGLALSSFAAGLELGFGVFLMGAALTLVDPSLSPLAERLLVANLYSVGFVFVVMGRSELFTEHTTLAVFPVLDRRAPVRLLLRLWIIVLSANLAGGLLFAFLITVVGPALQVVEPSALGEIAHPLLHHESTTVLLSAILAGWLMGLLSWLVAAGRDTISQVLFVWLVTTSIGILQLHHCIAGAVEVGSAFFAGADVSAGELVRVIALAIVGNSLGGAIFVALLKYGHVTRSAKLEESAATAARQSAGLHGGGSRPSK